MKGEAVEAPLPIGVDCSGRAVDVATLERVDDQSMLIERGHRL
jgi:hypothetical protein